MTSTSIFKKTVTSALLAALMPLALSRLVVYGPNELKDKFEYSGMNLIESLQCFRVQDTSKLRKLRQHPLWSEHGKFFSKLMINRLGVSTTMHQMEMAAQGQTSQTTSQETPTAF